MNVLIMGRAKTGTTVISKTIQNSLKGTTHYNLEPKNIGFFFEPRHFPDAEHQVVKIIFEHWNPSPRCRMGLIHNESPIKFEKRVCIVRDPRDEMLSRLMYFAKPWMDANGLDQEKNQRWIEALREKEANPQAISFIDMVKTLDTIYGSHMTHSVLNPKIIERYFNNLSNIIEPSYILRYEDFMQNKLTALEEYLDFKLSDNRDVGSLSRTRRSSSFDNWKRFFTQSDIDVLEPIYTEMMTKIGYSDWALDKTSQLKPEDFSEYVERLLQDS